MASCSNVKCIFFNQVINLEKGNLKSLAEIIKMLEREASITVTLMIGAKEGISKV
jgi:hypothetical protein